VTFDFWDLEFEIFEENNPDWGSEVFEFCSVPCVDWLVLKLPSLILFLPMMVEYLQYGLMI
jgi:hypothetical protein